MAWSSGVRAAAATALFAVGHSVLASLPVKQRVRAVVGPRLTDGLYRFGYCGVAVISFAAMVRGIWNLPDQRLYKLGGVPAAALRAGQLLCVAALVHINVQNGIGRVSGISNAWATITERPLAEPPVAQHPSPIGTCMQSWTGAFRWSSHPNNYLALLLYWLSPVMTRKWAGVGIATALYMALGSLHEDRRLAAAYGAPYRCYRRLVPHVTFRPTRELPAIGQQ